MVILQRLIITDKNRHFKVQCYCSLYRGGSFVLAFLCLDMSAAMGDFSRSSSETTFFFLEFHNSSMLPGSKSTLVKSEVTMLVLLIPLLLLALASIFNAD